ncbi:MAG TPA: hypothetical protein VEU96_12695 [Bryobacteraceae bacterium]|nr:hypothetical protein [Bryobacteraceae bacterium]
MSETTSYPHETRLNIHCQQGELIDERALADACAVVRRGVVPGEYHWHKHDDDGGFC